MYRWGHSDAVVHIGEMEVIVPVSDSATIGDVIIHCERKTGMAIQGLTSPNLLREGREWARHDRIRDLEGPFNDRIDLIALVPEWGFERLRGHHHKRFGHHMGGCRGGNFSNGGWGHSEAVVHIGETEVIFPVSDWSTIGDVITHCNDSTGMAIQGLTSPHLMRDGLEWARHDRVRDLKGPFTDRIDFIALLPQWGFDRLRGHHHHRFGHHW